MNKLKHINKSYLLLTVLLLFVYWQWWVPGIKVANDYPLIQISSLIEQLDIPRLWNSRGSVGLGEFGTFIFWSSPITFLTGLLAYLGISPSFQERMIYIAPIIFLGIIGIRKLLKRNEISERGILVSSFFYLTTTYLLLLIDGGQLSIALVYALLPLTYVTLTDSIHGNIRSKLSVLLIICLITALDVRFLFVLVLLLLLRFVFDLVVRGKENMIVTLKSYILAGSLIGFGWGLINFYWIVPILKYPLSSNLFSSLTQNTGIQPTTWKHALLLLQPHWYLNVFGKVAPIRWEFLLIPVMAFLVPGIMVGGWVWRKILSLRSRMTKEILRPFSPQNDNKGIVKNVMFWTVVAVVGIFLTKGVNPPFGEIYNFLFTNIPGFSLFRDSTKFFFLVAISYSVLIGYSIESFHPRGGSGLHPGGVLSAKIGELIVPIFFIAYLLFLISPVYIGKMTGMFSKPVYEKESFTVSDIIEKDDSFSRIFYIPSRAPLGYSSPTHPSVEALRLLSLRPFAIGVVGNYEKFNYLREAPFMGELFAVSGIKYLYYPYPDVRRDTLKQDNIYYYYAFLDQLTNLSWIEKKISDPPVAVLQTKKTKEHIFLAENSYYVIGSDRIYNDLMQIPDFDLSDNVFIFAEEEAGMINDIDPNSKVILYDKSDLDLLMSFVEKENYYFPASNVEREPSENENGLWKRETADFLWWRDFLQTKYGLDYQEFDYNGGWVIAEGDLRLTIDDLRFTKGSDLFARVMTSTKGGRIEIFQGKEKIGEINTRETKPEYVDIKLTGYGTIPDKISSYEKVNLKWFNVGRLLQDNEPLEIKMYGDLNVINVISTVTEEEWNLVSKLFDQIEIVDWEELSDEEKVSLLQKYDTANVSYKRIDPTKYEVEITGLTKPAYLIFSETFDELWELNGQPAKKVYSLLNGFYVDKDGRYTLYFTPQKYVPLGLIVSGFSLISILGILLILKRKK